MRSAKDDHDKSKESWGIINPPVIPDWEAAHVFLEVARCGSFRSAAQKLKQSVNVLRRRIDEFERELGVPLLVRHVNGVQPTAEGSKIYAAVLQMENASFNLLLERNLSDRQIEGEVRLAVTEGMGTAWVLPKLIEFQRANPRLTVTLKCGQSPPDLLRLEADLSIQLERPHEPDLKVVKLGRLHLMPFAAQSYLDAHGYPVTAADLAKHRFVAMADEERRWEELYQTMVPRVSPNKQVVIRNNVSSGHFSAVLNGAGIGFLPTYVQAIGSDLVPLDFGTRSSLDIWLTYRADAKRITRIRQIIEWAMEIYDSRRYPWFGNEFIHPDRFAGIYKGLSSRHPLMDVLNQTE